MTEGEGSTFCSDGVCEARLDILAEPRAWEKRCGVVAASTGCGPAMKVSGLLWDCGEFCGGDIE